MVPFFAGMVVFACGDKKDDPSGNGDGDGDTLGDGDGDVPGDGDGDLPGDGDGDAPGDGDGDAPGDGDGDGNMGGSSPSGGMNAGGAGSGGVPLGGASSGGESSGGSPPACENDLPILTEAPAILSAAGLYANIETKQVASFMKEFEPRFTLWSDGAVKTRWLYLPKCDPVIDTSDMNSWNFPVGTYSFKQFVVEGVLVETRMMHRYGPGSQEWIYAVYVWNDEKTEAELDLDGAVYDGGSQPYPIPSVAAGACAQCHGSNYVGQAESVFYGLPSRILGANAIDLSHDGPGLTMASLSNDDLLSDPAPNGFSVPGDATTVEAIGYLHANCGSCHNDTPLGRPFATPFAMRLKTTNDTVESTSVYQTAVDVPTAAYVGASCTNRIAGGNPGASCIVERMSDRGTFRQMPPIDTNQQHLEGIAAVQSWIAALPPP